MIRCVVQQTQTLIGGGERDPELRILWIDLHDLVVDGDGLEGEALLLVASCHPKKGPARLMGGTIAELQITDAQLKAQILRIRFQELLIDPNGFRQLPALLVFTSSRDESCLVQRHPLLRESTC